MKLYLNSVPWRVLVPFLIRCNKFDLDSDLLLISLMRFVTDMPIDKFKEIVVSCYRDGES